MTASDDLPLVQNVERWPVKMELPTLSILPVKHFTGRSEINEGGFLLAVNGRVLPCVFVGTAAIVEERLDEHAVTMTTLPYDEGDLFRALAKFDGGRLDYDRVQDLIRDGWRPEEH